MITSQFKKQRNKDEKRPNLTNSSPSHQPNSQKKNIHSLHWPEGTHANVPVFSTIRKKDVKTATPQTKIIRNPPSNSATYSPYTWIRLLATLNKQKTELGGRGPPPPHFYTTQCTSLANIIWNPQKGYTIPGKHPHTR